MKPFIKLFGAVVAAAAAFSSCNKVGESSYVDPYADIRPGMSIYNSVILQNTVATDPAAVAVRLAMLTEEAAAKEDASIDDVTVEYGGREQKLKSLLFGLSVSIEPKSSEDEGYADGDYLIRYRTTSTAPIDTFMRDGDYLVRTGGKSLSETTEAEPWSVEIASETMRLSTSSTVYILKPQGSVKLYRQTTDGFYRLDLEQIAAYFERYEQYTSDWTGNFFWKPSTDGDWRFSTHTKDTYTLYGQAQGSTFYSFNSSTPTRMSYRAEAMSPVEWSPEKTGSSTLRTSGTETCRLTYVTDYSAEDYPAPVVQVSRKTSENTIVTTVSYNGSTITL